MKKVALLIGVAALFVTLGVLFVMNYGINPRPIRVLNATEFDRPEEIGAVLFRRFYQEVRGSQLVVVGSSPFHRSYSLVWRSFLAVAKANRVEFDAVYTLEGLRSISSESLSYDEYEIQERLQRGEKVLIQVASTDDLLEKYTDKYPQALFIFQSGFAVTEEGLNNILPPCRDDDSSSFQMSCKAQVASRRYLRRPKSKEHYVAALERHSVAKYLLFIYEPEVSLN